MSVLKSQIDQNDPKFITNKAVMDKLIVELTDKTQIAAKGGSDRAREKHISRGKLLPRERVENLIDTGSAFLELSALAANDEYGCGHHH